MIKDATTDEINSILIEAEEAFAIYRNTSLRERADLLINIAHLLNDQREELIETAARETNLSPARLQHELNRTIFQLNDYASATLKGYWLDVRINHGRTEPFQPALRKMNVPLGPVVVFGASNFPFAYSTPGGDTAQALAAGCPVIVKAHPAHAETSELCANIISKAVAQQNLPPGIFSHIHGVDFSIGQALVEHTSVKAVGFTGSFSGGKALFDLAVKRKEPIPVYAEMGSVNPVFLLPGKLSDEAETIGDAYAKSITTGVGQFCTNPGLIIGLESEALQRFTSVLSERIKSMEPATMLHMGIFKSYVEKRANALAQEGVEMISVAEAEPQLNQGSPTIASVSAADFLENPVLHHEVFGPFSIIIRCKDMDEMYNIADHLEGQLTATIVANDSDLADHMPLAESLQQICGRLVLNGVPTGVEVNDAMHHGGPFPATTAPAYTSVGADGIKRFTRPVCFQNWPEHLLPDALKDANPLGIPRVVNGLLQ